MPQDPSTQTGAGDNGAVAIAVRELLGGVRQGAPVRSGALTLIPLLPADGQLKRQSGYLPLEEALRLHLITIAEQPSASVPELHATSTAEAPVVLVGGEQVIGGLQNRVLNTTILVAAHADLRIPVTCVEHGRWHEASEPYSYPTGETSGGDQRQWRAFGSEDAAYASLRKMHAKSVTASLSAGGGYRSDQSAVWGEVSDRMSRTRSFSPSGAMHALYKTPERASKLKETVDALPRPEGALGFIAVLGHEVLGAELFSDEALAAAYWEKLARSYAVEALDAAAQDTESSTETVGEKETRLLEEALAAKIEIHPSPGLGEDARLVGVHVSGAGLVHDGAVVHFSLFPEDDDDAAQPRRPERHYGGHRQSSVPSAEPAQTDEPAQRVEPD